MKKNKKKKTRRLLLFGTISVAVIVYFFYVLFSLSYNIYSLDKKRSELVEQLVAYEHDERVLSLEIDKLKDPDYIARFARENYQYSKDNEIIFQIVDEDEKIAEAKKKSYSGIIVVSASFLMLILIYIIKRGKKK